MAEWVATINSYVWSPALVYLCLGAGLLFSILTRFVQLRQFGEMIRLLSDGRESAQREKYHRKGTRYIFTIKKAWLLGERIKGVK